MTKPPSKISAISGIPNNPRPRNIRDRGLALPKPCEGGFIALMSAIIIATILLLVATTGGLTGIFARGNVLDAELKARSVAAADACVDQALLALANDASYTGGVGGDTYTLNNLDQCTVSVATVSGQSTLTIKGTSGANATARATTNLQVVANTADLSIVSWHEAP